MSGLTLAETILYQEDSASPLTVLKPLNAAINDLLVMVVADTDGVLSDISSATWFDEGAPVDVSGQRAKVFSHVVAGGDPDSWDFNYNSGSAMTAVLLRYTLADTTPVVVVTSNSTASNGSTLDSPDATPNGMDDVDVAIITSAGVVSDLTYVQPTGLTDLGSTHVPVAHQSLAAAWKTLTSSSPVGAQTWTSLSPTGRACGAFTILVKSSGVFDPDPPLKPPAPELPPWLLRRLLAAKARDLVGHQNTPLVKMPVVSGGASGANVVLTTPAPCDETDVLVAFHGNNFFTAAEMLTPTPGTWTERALGDGGTNTVHQKIWTAKVTTPGIQTITFTPAQDEEHTAHLFVLTGVDPDDFIDGTPAGSSGAASTSHIAPATSPTTPNALLLYGAMSGTATDYTIPAGAINNGAKKASEVDVPGFCSGATACQELATSGTTGTRTLTSSANSVWATATIAIKAGTPAAGGGTGWTVDHTDSAGLTDTATLEQQYVPTDDTGLTDATAISQTKELTDDAGLTDTATQELAKAVNHTDDAGLTDTAALEQQYVYADSAGLTDSAALTQAKELTDQAGLTDTANQELLKLVQATDETGLTDTANLEQGKTATDLAGLTDTAALQQAKVATDSAGLTDTSTLELAKLVAQTDVAGLTDTTALGQTLAATDTAGLTDTTALTRQNVATDPAGLTDTATTDLVRAITATDAAGLTDTTTYEQTLAHTDQTGLTDTATTAHTHVAAHTDDAGLTDTALAQLVAAFTPAHTAVEAGTTTGLFDNTTTAGTLDTATTTAGSLD